MKALLQQALEALENCQPREFGNTEKRIEAIAALRTAIAQAEQPVAWMSPGKERLEFVRGDTVFGSHTIPLYTTPQVPGAEPYAWHYWNNGGASVYHRGPSNQLNADMDAAKMFPAVHHCVPLYTHPQAAKPLSLAQCNELIYQAESLEEKRNVIALIRAVEAAHNIKEQQP